MMLGKRQHESSRPLALFAAQLGLGALGVTAAPAESTLAFLYPHLLNDQDNHKQERRQPRRASSNNSTNSTEQAYPLASSSSSQSSAPKPIRASSPTNSGGNPLETMPDLYELGTDGLWRKTHGWPPAQSACTMLPATATPSATIQLDGSSTSDGSIAQQTSATSLEEFDLSTLPDGWKLEKSISHSNFIAVICLSVAFACGFLVVILCLVAWRRRVLQRRRDLEHRLQSKGKPVSRDDSDSDVAQLVIASQRKWVRAGLRWRENVRVAARRRRSTRPASLSSSADSTAGTLRLSSIQASRSRLSLSEQMAPSRARSPVPSTLSVLVSARPPSPSLSVIATAPMPMLSQPSSTPPISPSSPPPAHPPAYHTPPTHTPAPLYARNGAPEPGPSKPRTPSHAPHSPLPSEELWPSAAGTDDYDWLTPHAEADEGAHEHTTGHVATDDKALLAARQARASEPASLRMTVPDAHAPDIREEEEEFGIAEFGLTVPEPGRMRDASPSYVRHPLETDDGEGEDVASPMYARHPQGSAFPPPPQPLSLRASEKMRSEYAYAFGRDDVDEERRRPSAPLLDDEMRGSAPPAEGEDMSLMASAPPEAPSAPPWELEAPMPLPSAPLAVDEELDPAHVPLPSSPT